MGLLRVTAFLCIFGIAELVAAQQRIDIDTLEDLYNTPGWIVTCDRGYQANTEDFACHNRLKVEIPAEDLRGEVGFWTGCQVECILTYTVRSTDIGMGFRAYAKGAHVTVIRNDLVREEIQGDKWMDISLDLNFTRTLGIKLPLIAKDVFAVLDKIYIIPQQPTTTTLPPTTTNATTQAPTDGTTLVTNTSTSNPNGTTSWDGTTGNPNGTTSWDVTTTNPDRTTSWEKANDLVKRWNLFGFF